LTNIPLAPVERIIKNAGVDRVSGSVARALTEVLEEHGTEVASKACKVAKHAGRKTVKAEDMNLAV
jgi:histone H3/H4